MVVVGSPIETPARLTLWVDPAWLLALSVITIAESLSPKATGENVVEMVQFAPGARVVPQVVTGAEKSSACPPVMAMLAIFRVSVPGFERVTVCAGVVEPTKVLLKVKSVVLRLPTGIP